jgi:hypothetical protein
MPWRNELEPGASLPSAFGFNHFYLLRNLKLAHHNFRSGAGHRYNSELISREISDRDARTIPLLRPEVNALFLADLAKEKAGQLLPALPPPRLMSPAQLSGKELEHRQRKNAQRREATAAARVSRLAAKP